VKDGKPLIIEGSHLDPAQLLPELEAEVGCSSRIGARGQFARRSKEQLGRVENRDVKWLQKCASRQSLAVANSRRVAQTDLGVDVTCSNRSRPRV
jgi:hypothetical protein